MTRSFSLVLWTYYREDAKGVLLDYSEEGLRKYTLPTINYPLGCHGNESRLSECPQNKDSIEFTSNNWHYSDAGLKCGKEKNILILSKQTNEWIGKWTN